MAGGEFPDGSASRSMWRYDPCFDSWQEMASMNSPRSELGMYHTYTYQLAEHTNRQTDQHTHPD